MSPQRDDVSPKQLSAELGVSERTIRAWLRKQGWQTVPYTRWRLGPDQAAKVRSYFLRMR
jgi:uncharacterized protein YjcR